MKGITHATIVNDIQTIQGLFAKYADAIWENQEGQKAHFDNQNKLARVAVCDVRSGLFAARQALFMLQDAGVLED